MAHNDAGRSHVKIGRVVFEAENSDAANPRDPGLLCGSESIEDIRICGGVDRLWRTSKQILEICYNVRTSALEIHRIRHFHRIVSRECRDRGSIKSRESIAAGVGALQRDK